MMHGCSTLPIGTIYGIPEDYHLLAQGNRVYRGSPRPIYSLRVILIDYLQTKAKAVPSMN